MARANQIRSRLLLLAALAAAAPALAQPAGPAAPDAAQISRPSTPGRPVPAHVAELIRQLNATTFAERDRARELLTSAQDVQLIDLEAALRSQPLTLEQSHAVAGAAWRRFMAGPRAAMGISFGMGIGDQGGVVIGNTVQGMPAHGILKPGDLVRAVNGSPVRNESHFRSLIIAHDPGEQVLVSVLRSGEPVNLKVTLGSFDDLPNPPMLDDIALAGAWEERSAPFAQRLTGAAPVIDPGLPPEPDRAELAFTRFEASRRNDGVEVFSGGEPRHVNDADHWADEPLANRIFLNQPAQPRDRVAAARQMLRARIEEARATEIVLQQQIRQINSFILDNQRRLENKDLPAQQRLMLTDANRQHAQTIALLELELRRVRDMLAAMGR